MAKATFTRRGSALGLLLALVLLWGAGGCGGESAARDHQPTLDAAETKEILLQLPYRYEFRNVKRPVRASAAVAGRAFARRPDVWFDFGISLGMNHPEPVPVPKGGAEVVGNPGFVFNSNLLVRDRRGRLRNGEQFRTAAQLHKAGHMATEMEQRLCRAITGEPCPV